MWFHQAEQARRIAILDDVLEQCRDRSLVDRLRPVVRLTIRSVFVRELWMNRLLIETWFNSFNYRTRRFCTEFSRGIIKPKMISPISPLIIPLRQM